jgi:hypothetical protein
LHKRHAERGEGEGRRKGGRGGRKATKIFGLLGERAGAFKYITSESKILRLALRLKRGGWGGNGSGRGWYMRAAVQELRKFSEIVAPEQRSSELIILKMRFVGSTRSRALIGSLVIVNTANDDCEFHNARYLAVIGIIDNKDSPRSGPILANYLAILRSKQRCLARVQ